MKTGSFKLFRYIGFFSLVTLAAVLPSPAQSGSSGNVKTSIAAVKTFNQATVIPYSGASLSRNNDGAFMTYSTTGLQEGTVVTLWWVFFNRPENCGTANCTPADLTNPNVQTSLHSAGGRIVGRDGSASFSAFLAVGDTTGFHILPGMPDPSPGLLYPKSATIHLVLRSHGPASSDPTVLAQQLTSFTGGCTMTNPCVNLQAAVFAQ